MKSKIVLISYVFLILAFVTAAAVPIPQSQADLPPETARYGIGTGLGALDWDPTEMFADVMKTFRKVTQPDGVTAVAVDAKGWPLADCRFLVWHGLNRAAGTYHLKFTGNASGISADGATVQNILYDTTTNTTTADILYDGLIDYLYLAFTGTSGGVKNIQLMLPGHTFAETWNRDFLAALEPMPVIRFMDFTATNWNHEVNWSDRTQPDAATQQSYPPGYGWQGKGIAWEYAIDLMNVTNKDGWFNIPAEANDAYVDSLINLIKNGGNGFAPLETERKLYIEYSNEVWNGMFDQAQFNHDRAVAEVNAGNSPLNFDGETNDYYWGWRRVGKRIVEISNQFRAAFGDAQMMTRFRPVLAWQYDAGQATAPQQLSFIQKYYGTDKWGYSNPHPVDYYLWCGGGALYYDDILLAQDTDFKNAVQTDSKYASVYGIHYCNYEGGMVFDGANDPDRFAAWVTQDMIDRQQYYEEHGGSLLMYFNLVSDNVEGLGFLQTIRNLNMPKYNAILQLAGQASPWQNAFGASLPMNKGGKDFSLIEGDWESPGSGATTLSPNAIRAYHYDADYDGMYIVWIEYSSTANIDLKIYAGSDQLATITQNTSGTATTSSRYAFNSTDGLRAVRIENHGSSEFNIIKVHVKTNRQTLTLRSVGAQDGWILESTETSGNGGTMNSAATNFYLGDNAAKQQYRAILSFNTSPLPDNAVITSVTLKLKKQGIAGGGNPVATFQGFMMDVKKGMFGAAPLALGDFKTAASKTVGPASPVLTAGWYTLNLTPAKSFINKLATGGGLTQIRLRFKLDDNNNAAANFLKIYSGNAGAANRPQLIIEYYLP